MTFHRDCPEDRDTSLDQWIKAALDAELAQMDAAFDFPAGLHDVYARAGLSRPVVAGFSRALSGCLVVRVSGAALGQDGGCGAAVRRPPGSVG
jgi:hypothetical protein